MMRMMMLMMMTMTTTTTMTTMTMKVTMRSLILVTLFDLLLLLKKRWMPLILSLMRMVMKIRMETMMRTTMMMGMVGRLRPHQNARGLAKMMILVMMEMMMKDHPSGRGRGLASASFWKNADGGLTHRHETLMTKALGHWLEGIHQKLGQLSLATKWCLFAGKLHLSVSESTQVYIWTLFLIVRFRIIHQRIYS